MYTMYTILYYIWNQCDEYVVGNFKMYNFLLIWGKQFTKIISKLHVEPLNCECFLHENTLKNRDKKKSGA